MSTGHVYGDALYFLTTLFDGAYAGTTYCRPEPFYFWVYFVGMNAVWLVIPGCMYLCGVLLLCLMCEVFRGCLLIFGRLLVE